MEGNWIHEGSESKRMMQRSSAHITRGCWFSNLLYARLSSACVCRRSWWYHKYRRRDLLFDWCAHSC